MKLSLYTIRRIRRIALISIAVALGVLFFSFLVEYKSERILLVLSLGFLFGIPLGIFEEIIFVDKFRNYSLLTIMIIKVVTYWISVMMLFGVSVFIIGRLMGADMQSYIEFFTGGDFLRGTIYILLVYDAVIVFNQYERLLGPRLAFFYAYGKYQRPEREDRIFMFLDLNASTHLAETLEGERYFGFINEFFHDITEPVLQCSAEIYQYVGDEVVFTWKTKHGTRNANCIRLYFKIEDKIKELSYKYKSRYNNIPRFKAGIHTGEIIASVVGDIKRELIYNGDVMNTTARIRSTCNELKKNLLISKDVFDKLENDDEIEYEDLGPVKMRGKIEPVHLYSITGISSK